MTLKLLRNQNGSPDRHKRGWGVFPQQQEQKRLPLPATGSTGNPSTHLHVIELSWCDVGLASFALVLLAAAQLTKLLSLQTGSEQLTTAISRLEQVTERLLRFEVRM